MKEVFKPGQFNAGQTVNVFKLSEQKQNISSGAIKFL